MLNRPPIPDAMPLEPASYAGWRTSDIGIITDRRERRIILQLIGDVADQDVLDVGCGDGELACELHGRGARVAGVDASLAMVKAAQLRARQAGTRMKFAVSTAQALPFENESFDIAAAITILCFVQDARPVFREIARVLRPGGRLVIGELGKWSSWAAQRRIRGWLGSPVWRNATFRTGSELRHCAEDAGLVVTKIRGAVYYPRWKPLAQLLWPLEEPFARVGTIGAAFIALSATKPE